MYKSRCLHFRKLLQNNCIPLPGAYNGFVGRQIALHSRYFIRFPWNLYIRCSSFCFSWSARYRFDLIRIFLSKNKRNIFKFRTPNSCWCWYWFRRSRNGSKNRFWILHGRRLGSSLRGPGLPKTLWTSWWKVSYFLRWYDD